MFRHFKTDINYAKLIEMQANQQTFGVDKKASINNVKAKQKQNNKVKKILRTRFK